MGSDSSIPHPVYFDFSYSRSKASSSLKLIHVRLLWKVFSYFYSGGESPYSAPNSPNKGLMSRSDFSSMLRGMGIVLETKKAGLMQLLYLLHEDNTNYTYRVIATLQGGGRRQVRQYV